MDILLCGIVVLALYMSGLFILSLIIKNNGIADVGYGVAFMMLVGAVAYKAHPLEWHALMLAVLPFIWGTRLAFRIARKNWGKPEDFRYRAWRETWGKYFVARSFLQIYMLQGLVVFIVALPVTLSIVFPASMPNMTLIFAGAAVWVVGFLFESIADFQLDRFIRNPENKGSIMMRGLWRYSRHPNYFGESLMWWGIALCASGSAALPLLGFVSPLLITYLLLFVSGVPMLEKRWEGNPEWDAYKARTSVFVPLPVKKESV